jgi:hypothetical protein
MINLDWVNFQVMRRTHASLSRKAGIDPKLVADQLGHGLGVNLDVYTISDLTQRLKSVNLLEQSLALMEVYGVRIQTTVMAAIRPLSGSLYRGT